MKPHRKSLLFGALAWLLLPTAATFAVNPDEMLSDPVLESRARAISQDLRCVVCPNQPIDDSSAPLAKDLRILIRERLKAGDTDADAKTFIVARYGNFVLLKPPVQPSTLLLWFAPALLAAGVLIAVLRYLRHQQSLPPIVSVDAALSTAAAELTADETNRLREILEKGSES
jgi:cytochrome c-type biogenesis protein CcmH